MSELWSIFSRAVRVWRGAPVLGLSIIVLLSTGIAGVAAVLSPMYSLVLSPIPFPFPDQLARVGGTLPLFNTYTNRLESRDRVAQVFQSVAAYAPATQGPTYVKFAPQDSPKRITALAVTTEFFETILTPPRLGRGFEHEQVGSPVVVISDRLWQTEFHHAETVVGATLWIGATPHTVAGVMPPGLDFPGHVELWVVLGSTAYAADAVQVIGRVRAGLSIRQASAALETMGLSRKPGPSGQLAWDGRTLQPWQTFLRGDARAVLWTLLAVSGLFLLATCVGVVNLLFAHGVRRRVEIAVRLALGAGRWSVVAESGAEVLPLAAAGGSLGTGVSVVLCEFLESHVPELSGGRLFLPMTVAIGIVLTLFVTLICGLLPALNAIRTDPSTILSAKGGGAKSTIAFARRLAPQEILAGAQLAVALALLIASGLLLRSLFAEMGKPLGFVPTNVAVFHLAVPVSPKVAALAALSRSQERSRKSEPATSADRGLRERTTAALTDERRDQRIRNTLVLREFVDFLRKQPNVETVGIVDPTPFTDNAAMGGRWMEYVSSREPSGAQDVRATRGWASEDGFRALGIPLLAGRWFSSEELANELSVALADAPADSTSSRLGVVIINEALATQLWSTTDVVGKRLKDPYRPNPYLVVGVVANSQWTADIESRAPAIFYPFVGANGSYPFVVKLHEGADTQQLSAGVVGAAERLAPGAIRPDVRSLRRLTEATLSKKRVVLALLSSFAVLACAVAALGVYATSTAMAEASARNAGIRMALGADKSAIFRWALSRSIRPIVVGVPAGLLGGWILIRQISHSFVQVSSTDTPTYLVCTMLLLVVALSAALLPVLRTVAVEPAMVLRSE